MKLTKTTKTYNETPASWVVVDAKDKVLGRISTQIAEILRGKNKAKFTPNYDNGDFVVVINAEKVKLTGNKLEDKQYRSYSGYISGMTSRSADEMLNSERADQVIYLAVKRMLPKNRLSDAILTKLKIYTGETHPHIAQKPSKIEIEG
jgi:large subunit ribosomal protein L13